MLKKLTKTWERGAEGQEGLGMLKEGIGKSKRGRKGVKRVIRKKEKGTGRREAY